MSPVTFGLPATTAYTADPRSLYMVLLIDIDVHYQNQITTFLHYFAANLLLNFTSPVSASSQAYLVPAVSFRNSSVIGASYYPPSPPSGEGLHRYVSIVFSQPEDFNIPDSYQQVMNPPTNFTARLGFSLEDLVKKSKLQGKIVAGSWFTEVNGTQNGTATGTESGDATGSALATGGNASTGAPTQGSGVDSLGGIASIWMVLSAIFVFVNAL